MLRRYPRHPARLPIPLMLAGAIGLAGYFAPWAPSRAAGLNITGLDLAEYVKFLPQAMAGQIALRREIFYLPLLAGSLSASLLAARRSVPNWLRVLLGLGALPLALSMLPPAWSPGLLLQPEFRLQVLAILICLLTAAGHGLTRHLPDRLALGIVAALALAGAIFPTWSYYFQVGPAIAGIYGQALPLGWGFWANGVGFALAAFCALAEMLSARPRAK